MSVRARVLLGLIGLAISAGVIGWIVRYQPFGPAGPLGTPLPSGATVEALSVGE
jgi:hypothetical protein